MPGLFDVDFDLNFDPNAFTNELVAGADIDDASKAAISAILAKPVVAQRLKNGVALRSEAQRAMDRARTIATEAERVRDANFQWAADNKPALEAWLASQNGGGNGSGGGGRSVGAHVMAPSGDFLTKADVAKMLEDIKTSHERSLAAQDEQYVGVLTDTVSLMQQWNREFPNEEFPFSELQQFALGKRMTLRNAFPQFIEPKMAEKRTADIERIKREAFEAGKLEGMSQREEPSAGEVTGDLGSAFKDVLLGSRRTQTLDNGGKALEGEDAFVANWNRTHGFTRPNTNTQH